MLNALEVTALSSSAVKRRRFRSSPFLHSAVRWCSPFRDRHGSSMLHRGHHGWGRFPSSSITTVYWTCRCQNFIRMAVRVAARTLHPSTGKGLGPVFARNTILNVMGSSPPPSPSPSFPNPPLSMLCWVCRCIASNPLAKSFPYSGQ